MNYIAAQQGLAATIKQLSLKTSKYFWRLGGGHANSLSKFLCIEDEEMTMLLRLCQVYKGPKDHLNRNNLELFLSDCGVTDYNPFKPKLEKKSDYFLCLGSVGELALPSEQYDDDGNLSLYPVVEMLEEARTSCFFRVTCSVRHKNTLTTIRVVVCRRRRRWAGIMGQLVVAFAGGGGNVESPECQFYGKGSDATLGTFSHTKRTHSWQWHSPT